MVAACMAVTCRIEDVVCRYSGEKFAVIVPNTPAVRATVMAERLRKGIEKLTLSHRGASVPLTCSFGIADLEYCGEKSIFDAADAALSRAKQLGRDRIELFGAALVLSQAS